MGDCECQVRALFLGGIAHGERMLVNAYSGEYYIDYPEYVRVADFSKVRIDQQSVPDTDEGPADFLYQKMPRVAVYFPNGTTWEQAEEMYVAWKKGKRIR